MIYLAHNGVEHATELEAAAHQANTPVIAIVLISIAVVGGIIATIYGLHKFGIISLPTKDREDSK